MGDVVGFPKKELEGASNPHLEGPAHCIKCGHQWRCVAPVGTVVGDVHLQCPACSLRTGVFASMVEPEAERWACGCGNQLFFLTPTGAPLCCACGLRATSWADG